MLAVVSLLDAASEQVVRALWAELEQRHGLHEATRLVPWPHSSYHVAEDYTLARLGEILTRVAAQAQPFGVTIHGLGAFVAPEPVLYLAVERNDALDALHTALWSELERAGVAQGSSPLYAPGSWIPHITLAQRDLTLEALREIQAEWATRDLRREVWVGEIALLYRAAGAMTYEPMLRHPLGSVAGA